MSEPRFLLNTHAARLPLRLSVIFFICLYGVKAQSQGGKENQKGQDEVLTLKARLITTDVMVKDKKGKFVTDLKAEDFTIFENGVRQRVEFFDPPLAIGKESVQSNTTQPEAAQPNAANMI